MKEQYANPILRGFYPDPGIVRVNEDYYLVTSTFAYWPGIPVFHSRDLVNWKLITHAISRPEQMHFTGLGVSKGIFAPSINYTNGIFYITCTSVDGGGNFILTAEHPAGPWSMPVWLEEINGIDPSLFFDEDQQAYLVYNSVAPGNKALYNGHRTIRMRKFNALTLQPHTEEIILINGGTDPETKPRWIEGPHIFRKSGYYYLVAAEGGTGYDHSVVVFRSSNVSGPYLSYDKNPILTQREQKTKLHPITSTGHAQLVDTPDGTWHAVFLGCRPYEHDHYNTGRETFLAPVHWTNDWPLINSEHEAVQYFYPAPLPYAAEEINHYSGNFRIRDEFNDPELDKDYIFLRHPPGDWLSLTEQPGFLRLKLKPDTCSGKLTPSFVGRRQQHLFCSAIVSMSFRAVTANEKAGLLIFQNEDHFYFLCTSLEKNRPVIQLFRSVLIPADGFRMEAVCTVPLPDYASDLSYLKIQAAGKFYHFSYSMDNMNWIPVLNNVDARYLSTATAGGFVGCCFALYATSHGELSGNVAFFDWFEYFGEDEIFQPDPVST